MELPDNTFISDYGTALKYFGADGVRPTYELTKEWLQDVPMWAANCYALNLWCTIAFDKYKEYKKQAEGATLQNLKEAGERLAQRFYDLSQLFASLYHDACALGYDTYEGDEVKSSQFFHFID